MQRWDVYRLFGGDGMTACTCPIAGYCDRHRTEKNEHWHMLCQTREDYFAKWERGRGPGQTRIPEEREARRQRIAEATARKIRLLSWLKLLRNKADVGIGDTAARLVKQRKKSKIWVASDAHNAVNGLLKQCSCSRIDAIKRLNEEYPY